MRYEREYEKISEGIERIRNRLKDQTTLRQYGVEPVEKTTYEKILGKIESFIGGYEDLKENIMDNTDKTLTSMYVTSGTSVLAGVFISKDYPEIGKSLMEGGFCGMLMTNILDRIRKTNKPSELEEEYRVVMNDCKCHTCSFSCSCLAILNFVLKNTSGVTDILSIPASTRNLA